MRMPPMATSMAVHWVGPSAAKHTRGIHSLSKELVRWVFPTDLLMLSAISFWASNLSSIESRRYLVDVLEGSKTTPDYEKQDVDLDDLEAANNLSSGESVDIQPEAEDNDFDLDI